MKTSVKILASLSAILALAACQQFKIDTQMTPEKAAANIRLVCDAVDAYTFPAQNPGTETFNISSNTPWTITRSSGADWCSVTPSSSASSSLISDVVISVKPNTDDTDRSCTLTVKGDNVNKVYTITVVQARNGKLYVTPIPQDYAACGGPLSFTFLTNQPWEVRSDVSWISFNRQNGEPDPEGRSITIIATAEPSTVLERVATITVTAGDDEESFDVSQLGTLTVAELSDAFPGAGGSQSFKLRTDLPWSVECDKTWLSFDKESGDGDGSTVTITATATANDGAVRTATVTVLAGDAKQEFEVSQKGAAFEIVAPESTALPRLGGEMSIEVNSSMSWEPETDVDGWSVEKVDDTHFKVKASFNNIFKPKTGKVAIVSGTNRDELELSQDINFTFDGNYEILDDGSVKLIGDKASHIILKDAQRYGIYDLELGAVNFAASGNMWFENLVSGDGWSAQLYNWCVVGKTRLRAEGSVSSGKSMNEAGTNYMSKDYSLSEAEFNAMTGYKMSVTANEEDASLLDMAFFYNGEARPATPAKCQNPFYGNEIGGTTKVGFHSAATAETWYIVKSFSVTVIE